MAALVAQLISRTGIAPEFAAAAALGDYFANTGTEYIHVKNADAEPHTVTIATQVTVDGLAVAERTLTVASGEEKICGPFPRNTYSDANGRVQLTYDAVTDVTIGVFKPGS